jgi:hypothetical protein
MRSCISAPASRHSSNVATPTHEWSSSGAHAQLAYATSALAVRRLLDDAGGAAVANLLRDLGEGVEFEAAFLHRIQRSFADFQATTAF